MSPLAPTWRGWGGQAQKGKNHPEQMKQLDVNSPQTQLSTQRGATASYRATLNKTYVGGIGVGLGSLVPGDSTRTFKNAFCGGPAGPWGQGWGSKRSGQEAITKCQRLDS